MARVRNLGPERHAWLIPLSAGLLAIALYAHTLAGTWIYDDVFHAREDPRLTAPGGWRAYWTEGYVPGAADHLWRPIVSTSYLVQCKVSGARAWPFHLVNILLHALASALVAVLAGRLTQDSRVAAAAGLLFAAHPIHVEAVAYVVGRAESLCAIGMLGAMVLMLRPMTVGRALAVWACFVVAVLSKEQGLLLPPMLMALWVWRRRAPQAERLNGWTALSADGDKAVRDANAGRLLLVLVLFTFAAYVIYREHILPWYWETNLLDYATQPMIHSGVRDRLLIPVALLGRATALFVLPIKLSPEYGLAVITARQDLRDPYLYVGLISLGIALIVSIEAIRRRAWTVLLLLGCAGLTYGMVSNVKLIGVVFAERLLYLPSAFVLILAAIALGRWLPRRVMAGVLAALVIALGVRTITYAATWNDRLGFYERSVAASPRSARLRVLLAGALIARGDYDRARQVTDVGLAIAPDYWKLWTTAGRIAVAQDRLDDARADVERAWALDPFPPEVVYVQELIDRRAAAATTTRP